MPSQYSLKNYDDGSAVVLRQGLAPDGSSFETSASLEEPDALQLNYCLWALDELLAMPGYAGNAEVIQSLGQFLLELAYYHWED